MSYWTGDDDGEPGLTPAERRWLDRVAAVFTFVLVVAFGLWRLWYTGGR